MSSTEKNGNVFVSVEEASSNNEKNLHTIEVGSVSSLSGEDDDLVELAYKEPLLATRMFYAQRYMEQQYEDVIRESSMFRGWNDWVKKSLTIESLAPKTDKYPKWNNDNLSLRSTHWIVCTGLLTSEIMGAYLVPNSIGMTGYVPANILLTVCFGLTILAGVFSWWMFMLYDSPEYPVKSLAEIGYIIGGSPVKHLVISLQLIAMILTTATTLLGAAESIIVVRDERICWAVVTIVLAVAGGLVGGIKRLSHIGKFCLLISFCNYINLYVQLGYIKSGTVNWANALAVLGLDQGPILTYAIAPATLVNKIVAVSNISYVFAGSIVFPELLSEMKRPWDFWKSMIVAQVLIFGTYLLYGNFIYSYQGQFANSPAVFGISDPKALKGLAVITFLVGFIQTIFYGHVSSKIFFKNYLSRVFKGLKYHSKKGVIIWWSTCVAVWAVAYVIMAGVPQVSAISSFTSALAMIPLTYCIPFVFQLFAMYQKFNAEKYYGDYDEVNMTLPEAAVQSSKSALALFKLAFKRTMLFSTFLIVIALGALAFSGLGVYGSVEYMKLIFATAAATSFSCKSPI